MKKLTCLLFLLVISCNSSSNNTESCTVEPAENGAVIKCPDGTNSVIVNQPIEDDEPEDYPVAQPVINITNVCHFNVFKLKKKWLLFNKYKFIKFLKHGKHVVENCEINVNIE